MEGMTREMMTLEQAREEINNVDKEIAVLFQRRMKAVEAVIDYKLANGLQIFDAAREAQVIEKNTALIKDPKLVGYFRDFIISMMDISKKYQQDIACESDRSAGKTGAS